AKLLNDKKLEPMLVDPHAGVSLVIPVMENVGQLRQTSPPEDGKSYWMVFSNKGRQVKRGDHVNVVIGAFHANGLVIDHPPLSSTGPETGSTATKRSHVTYFRDISTERNIHAQHSVPSGPVRLRGTRAGVRRGNRGPDRRDERHADRRQARRGTRRDQR